MSQEYAAKGTLLKRGDGGTPTENFTAIAQVQDIQGIALVLNHAETTHHGSTAKEFVATLHDGGEVSFTIVWDPAEPTHKNAAGGLTYDMLQKTKRNFQLVFPDVGNSIISFAAFVVAFEPEAPVANALKAKVKLKVTGLPVLP